MPKIKLPARLSGGLQKLSYRQLLVLSAAVALLCGALVLFLLPSGEEEQPQEAAPARVKVVVAKQDIPQRAIVKESMLEVVEMPPDVLPPGTITDMVSVVDRPASVPIQQGDILTDKKVLVDPRAAGFTGMIPENCRANTRAYFTSRARDEGPTTKEALKRGASSYDAAGTDTENGYWSTMEYQSDKLKELRKYWDDFSSPMAENAIKNHQTWSGIHSSNPKRVTSQDLAEHSVIVFDFDNMNQ